MRNSRSVVIVENDKVALIQRTREGAVYYVFPGGCIENKEPPEAGAKREAYEELGVNVEIQACIAKVNITECNTFSERKLQMAFSGLDKVRSI